MTKAKAGRLRWKREPNEKGLARSFQAPRGCIYHDGVTEYARVYPAPTLKGYPRSFCGWYWVARVDGLVPLCNTCYTPVGTVDEAKREAQQYIKECIEKARDV
jgi:hypothetical protein